MKLSKENMIGQGNTAEIYKIEEGKILKLFRNGLGKETIDREYENNLAIQKVLDCVPKAYDLVEVNGRYGIIYDEVDGTDMLKKMLGSLGKIKSYAERLAVYHLYIQKPINGSIVTVKQKLKEDLAEVNCFPEEQKEIILKYLDTLPDGDVLCHFDFHPGNVMIAGERAFFLDWMTACKGDAS